MITYDGYELLKTKWGWRIFISASIILLGTGHLMLRIKYADLRNHGYLVKVGTIQEMYCTKVGCKFKYDFIDHNGVKHQGKETVRLWEKNLLQKIRSDNEVFYAIFSSVDPSNNEMVLLDDLSISIDKEMLYKKPPEEIYRTLKYFE